MILARMYLRQEHYSEAESLLAQVLATRKQISVEQDPSTLAAMQNLAQAYQGQKRYAEAEELYMRVLELRRQVKGEQHRDTISAVESLALLYLETGRYDESESLLLTAFDVCSNDSDLGQSFKQYLGNDLIRLYEAWDKPEKAKRWRAKLRND